MANSNKGIFKPQNESTVKELVASYYKNKEKNASASIRWFLIKVACKSALFCNSKSLNDDVKIKKSIFKARNYISNLLNIENYISLTHRVENIKTLLSIKSSQTKYVIDRPKQITESEFSEINRQYNMNELIINDTNLVLYYKDRVQSGALDIQDKKEIELLDNNLFDVINS